MTNKSDWVIAFTTAQGYLAALAEQALENQGIETVRMDKKDSSYLFGQIDVMVKSDDESEAKQIIAGFKKDLDIE
ncbi:MAG: putative signal transducing protein [Bacteroidota bacterium]